MAKVGRKPTPTAILKLRGSYKANRPNEPVVEPCAPPPPPWLRKDAAQYWPELAAMLARVGLMGEPYTIALAMLTDALADFVRFSDACEGQELVLVSGNGSKYPNPIFGMRNAAWKRVQQAAAEFGLSPSAVRGVQKQADSRQPLSGVARFRLNRGGPNLEPGGAA